MKCKQKDNLQTIHTCLLQENGDKLVGISQDILKKESQKAVSDKMAVSYSGFDNFTRKIGLTAHKQESLDRQLAVPEIPEIRLFRHICQRQAVTCIPIFKGKREPALLSLKSNSSKCMLNFKTMQDMLKFFLH